jgi:hypothetical protein
VIALDQTNSGQPVKGTWSLYMDGTAGNSSSWWVPEDTGDWWVYMQAPKLTDKVIDALSLGPPWPLMK